MKKFFTLISVMLMSVLCLTGCDHPIHTCPLETVEVSSYVKEEVKISGAAVFFCIFGSYKKDSHIIQRYIFLAGNGPRDSYKINDVHVYNDYYGIPGPEYHVYFNYIEEGAQPYLEYRDIGVNGWDMEYYLYLPKTTVLEIANEMFRDS